VPTVALAEVGTYRPALSSGWQANRLSFSRLRSSRIWSRCFCEQSFGDFFHRRAYRSVQHLRVHVDGMRKPASRTLSSRTYGS